MIVAPRSFRLVRLRALFGAMLLAPMLAHPAFALRDSRPLATDPRIHTMMFSADEVYKFTGHYGYQSTIEFAPDEEIQTISMGDSVSWLLEPSGNRIFLKPLEQNATTNMTVLTNKRSYLFELHAREASNINDPQLVFVLRFMYPSDANDYISGSSIDNTLPDLEDPEVRNKMNFNYTLRGKENIAPLRVFDDGEFTYFEFRNKNADVPAFFLVDSQGKEALINYRTRGDFIVVERVWGVYTLRHGPDLVCVYNESWNGGAGRNVKAGDKVSSAPVSAMSSAPPDTGFSAMPSGGREQFVTPGMGGATAASNAPVSGR